LEGRKIREKPDIIRKKRTEPVSFAALVSVTGSTFECTFAALPEKNIVMC